MIRKKGSFFYFRHVFDESRKSLGDCFRAHPQHFRCFLDRKAFDHRNDDTAHDRIGIPAVSVNIGVRDVVEQVLVSPVGELREDRMFADVFLAELSFVLIIRPVFPEVFPVEVDQFPDVFFRAFVLKDLPEFGDELRPFFSAF